MNVPTKHELLEALDILLEGVDEEGANLGRFERSILVGFLRRYIESLPEQGEAVYCAPTEHEGRIVYEHSDAPIPMADNFILYTTLQPEQGEAVAAQCRFNGSDWGPCTVAHHLLVQANPKDWPHYETRLLYTTPQPAPEDRMEGLNMYLTSSEDGVFAHFQVSGGYRFGINLDAQELGKRFCEEYRAYLAAITSEKS